MQSFHHSFSPLGDAAMLIDFGNVIDEATNREVHRVFQQLNEADIPGVIDVVPAYSSLGVFYDVAHFAKCVMDGENAFDAAVRQVQLQMQRKEPQTSARTRTVRVPVCYESPYGPDLQELSAQKGCTQSEVIGLHTSRPYRVYMIGFLPGFAYMGTVAAELDTPRKSEPRALVPAGSVGIAGRQTGIYPIASPGGWQIIGRTPLTLFDRTALRPVFFEPGDEVIFYPITAHEFANYQDRPL